LQVQEKWKEMLLEAGWKDASYLDAYCNQVKTCTKIALNCVESNSHKRPSIEEIITMLNETEETIDKLYRQLFVVKPLNLCFPFEPHKLIRCPVHLTNNSDHPTAFKIQPNTDIIAGSLRGFVPARTTHTCILTMQKQRSPPPNLDTIRIQSVVANLDTEDFFLFSIEKNIDRYFTKPEAVHDETKEVKIMSRYECASQLASSKVCSVNILLIFFFGVVVAGVINCISSSDSKCPSDN
jgi:hypothetical protein